MLRGLIPEQSFTVMSVVCHEWRRQVTKHGEKLGEWFGRGVYERRRKGEVGRKSGSDV